MRWKLLTNSRACVALAVAALAASMMLGCAHTINPFADESIPREAMTTASERRVRQAGATPDIRQRDWPQTATSRPTGEVVHWPTWFEDPFEDKGSEDGKYAWTGEDYLAMPYSMARLLLNTMGWPVSAVLTPPGMPMASDGRLSRQALGKDHDATSLAKHERTVSEGDMSETDRQAPGTLADESKPADPEDALEGPPFVEKANFEREQ